MDMKTQESYKLKPGEMGTWSQKLAELKREVKAQKDYEAKELQYAIQELTR